MNGIEKITQRINEEAKNEIEQLREKTRQECEKIKSEYKEIAQNEYWKIVTKGKEDADNRAERMRGVAQTEAKKQMLALKQEMVARAFKAAEDKIVAMSDKKYTGFMISLVTKNLRSGKEELIMSKSDKAKYGTKIVNAVNEERKKNGKTAELSLSEETRQLRGGLILKEGKIEINCSIETIMEMRRNELSAEVAKRLFE